MELQNRQFGPWQEQKSGGLESHISAITSCMKSTETTQTIIKVETMSAEVFEIVVEYLYTGKAYIQPLLSVETLNTADELGLNRLFQICEHEIAEHSDSENVLVIIKGAEYINATRLLDACIYVIIANLDKLSSTQAYNELSDNIKIKIESAKQEYERKLQIKRNKIIYLYKSNLSKVNVAYQQIS